MLLGHRASSMRPLLPHHMAVRAQPAKGGQPAGTGLERRTALGCAWCHQHQQPCSLCKLPLHLLQPRAGCPSLHSMRRQGQVGLLHFLKEPAQLCLHCNLFCMSPFCNTAVELQLQAR